MDSTEPQEPSYYEVALTNRQVLVAFVALLSCLLVSFLAGVWIGRGGAEAAEARIAATPATKAGDPPLEQLSFFGNGDAKKGGARESATEKPTESAAPTSAASAASAPSPPSTVESAIPEPAAASGAAIADAGASGAGSAPSTAEADASDQMRRNLEETMAANRETPAMKMAAGERTAPPPAEPAPAPPKPATAATKPASNPAASAPAGAPAAGKIWVQVYSSGNGARAREIVQQLRKAGFPVLLAEQARGAGKVFRVRVGPYDDRAKADASALRLRRDQRLDTWVTDSP